jgi:hypothetical protein
MGRGGQRCVVGGGCGSRDIHAQRCNSECRQVPEVGVGIYQRNQDVTVGRKRATQPATQRSPPSPRVPVRTVP